MIFNAKDSNEFDGHRRKASRARMLGPLKRGACRTMQGKYYLIRCGAEAGLTALLYRRWECERHLWAEGVTWLQGWILCTEEVHEHWFRSLKMPPGPASSP